jgi:exodeoxyribonuclease V alpha subunit
MSDPSNIANSEILLRGVVDRIKFQNSDNGYTVFSLKVTGKAQPYTVVGTSPGLVAGTALLVRGQESSHSKYGTQIQAKSITHDAPTSVFGIERFLSSGIIKGIGEKTAEVLVNEFGEQTLTKLVEDPDAVAKIPGVGKSKALKLRDALVEKKSINEVIQFLVENGLSTNLAAKIQVRYGNRAIELLKSDPYLLSRDMQGIGFKKADAIALGFGFALNSPERVKAALYHAMQQSLEDGHCYVSVDQLKYETFKLLGEEVAAEVQSVEVELQSLLDEKFIHQQDDKLYLESIYKAESFVAEFIATKGNQGSTLEIHESIVKKAIHESELELGISFSSEQRDVVSAAIDKRFFVITGGPGCGKTTIVKALSKLFALSNKRLALTAPTGRAAQRMSQVCGMDASTIHRLIKFDPFTRQFYFNASNPLEVDVVIVDESSMIDIQLAKSLFSAIPEHATLILVGDKDQLPSVGPGKVFQDIVSIRKLKIIGLTKLYRREGQSQITEIAHMINSGNIPSIPSPDGETKTDAYFIEKKNPADALTLIESLYTRQLKEKFGFAREQILILTPTNRGELGTESLNKRIQEAINPGIGNLGQGMQQLVVGNFCLRVGDRVCQRVNNYQIDDYGVFNGDLGTVVDIDPVALRAQVELWDGRVLTYESADLTQLSLAYAVTVHRSQGSEVPCVIMILHDSHYRMLERQLIYTGITRAKKLLVLVGTKSALKIATQRALSLKRQTNLSQIIAEKLA